MREMIKEAMSSFSERARSRFWILFLMAFAAHNWEFFFLLFASPFTTEYNELAKLRAISNSWANFYMVPLGAALGLSIAIPYIDAAISWALMPAQKWNKLSSIRLQSEVEYERAIILKKRAESLITIKESQKVIAATKERDPDAEVFARLNNSCSEFSIRNMLEMLDADKRIHSSELSQLSKMLINGDLVENRLEDEKLRTAYEYFSTAAKRFIIDVRTHMNWNPTLSSYDFGGSPEEKEQNHSVIYGSMQDTLIAYVQFRKEVKGKFDI